MSETKPTAAELAILCVLWERGCATVREVHDALSATQQTGYTTVLKLMQIMHRKGLLVRDDSAMAHVYAPATPEAQTKMALVRDFLDDVFDGSAQQLVLRALSVKPSTPEELAEIRHLLDRLENDA